jgi:hypothetical protein
MNREQSGAIARLHRERAVKFDEIPHPAVIEYQHQKEKRIEDRPVVQIEAPRYREPGQKNSENRGGFEIQIGGFDDEQKACLGPRPGLSERILDIRDRDLDRDAGL